MSKGLIQKVKVALTISRPNSNDGKKTISLKLEDRASGIQFVDIEFSTSDFMEALTGLSHVEGAGKVQGLENVGKVRETESTLFIVNSDMWSEVTSGDHHTRYERGNAYLREQFARDGWFVASRLGSQNAEYTDGDNTKILGYYYRYVNKEAV